MCKLSKLDPMSRNDQTLMSISESGNDSQTQLAGEVLHDMYLTLKSSINPCIYSFNMCLNYVEIAIGKLALVFIFLLQILVSLQRHK